MLEGVDGADDTVLKKVYEQMLESITVLTDGKVEGHLALKLTSMVSVDIMTKLSRAQEVYANEILRFNKKEPIDIEDLRSSLQDRGIIFSEGEI
jgi:hypothetical protein